MILVCENSLGGSFGCEDGRGVRVPGVRAASGARKIFECPHNLQVSTPNQPAFMEYQSTTHRSRAPSQKQPLRYASKGHDLFFNCRFPSSLGSRDETPEEVKVKGYPRGSINARNLHQFWCPFQNLDGDCDSVLTIHCCRWWQKTSVTIQILWHQFLDGHQRFFSHHQLHMVHDEEGPSEFCHHPNPETDTETDADHKHFSLTLWIRH